MKKKVVILSLALMLVFAGVVSAASIWGQYKGFDIIRITVDGAPVKTDVPAFVFNNRTMVPVYLLKEAGISYSADGKNQTVDIKKPKSGTTTVVNDNSKIKSLFKIADFYKQLNDLGETLKGTSDSLHLAFTGINQFDSRESLDSAYDSLDLVIKIYNAMLDKQTNLYTDFIATGTSQNSINQVLGNYYDAIDYYKAAIGDLESYYINLSMQSYNSFASNQDAGFDLAINSQYTVMTRYNEVYKQILAQ